MAQPPESQWWQTLLLWIKDNTLQFMIFALIWKGIDKVFKFASESRDERIKNIVKEQMKPLEDKIDKLTEVIFAFKTHQ